MNPNLEKFLGFKELKTKAFYKAVVCEFGATVILIVCGCGAGVTMNEGKPLDTLTSALIFGMVVAYIIWTFNHISGAHINPVVSLAFLVTGHISLTKTIAYTVAQVVGAIAGSAVIWFMIPDSWRGSIGSTVFSKDVTLAQGFAAEAFSTFTLLLGVFATSDQYRTDHAGSLSLSMGLIVFIESAWAGKLTGASMNPARTLGPALISGTWDHHWVYWVAPTVGAIAGALLYQHVLAENPHREDLTIQVDVSKSTTKQPKEEKPTTKPAHRGSFSSIFSPKEEKSTTKVAARRSFSTMYSLKEEKPTTEAAPRGSFSTIYNLKDGFTNMAANLHES